jgi:hypothetical protein
MLNSEDYLERLNVAGAIITLQERTRLWHIALVIVGIGSVVIAMILMSETPWAWVAAGYGGWMIFAGMRVRKARAKEGLLLASLSCFSLCVGIVGLQAAQLLTAPKPRLKPGALILAFFAGKFAWELWSNRKRLQRLAMIAEQEPMLLEQTQQFIDEAARDAPQLMRLTEGSFWLGDKQWYLSPQGDVVAVALFRRKVWKRAVDEVFWVRRRDVVIQPTPGKQGVVNAQIGEQPIENAKVAGEGALMFGVVAV